MLYRSDNHRHLHSFPTRRSSDLLGFGLPMRPPNYSNQRSVINTAFEFGQRGGNSNLIKENFFKISFGFTLRDRKSTRLNSSHMSISYAVFCLKKKNIQYR